jgi:hypothetical protein
MIGPVSHPSHESYSSTWSGHQPVSMHPHMSSAITAENVYGNTQMSQNTDHATQNPDDAAQNYRYYYQNEWWRHRLLSASIAITIDIYQDPDALHVQL